MNSLIQNSAIKATKENIKNSIQPDANLLADMAPLTKVKIKPDNRAFEKYAFNTLSFLLDRSCCDFIS